MSKIVEKLKLGSHYKIERFGVLFSVLTICLGIVTGTIFVKAHNDDKETLSARALYTTDISMSRTGTTGQIQDIYSNSDHTKAFVMVKFGDVSKISTNADDWCAFLTGSSLAQKPTHLNINPSGVIYMFGTTGYMGIYLTEAMGFENQILDLTLRCSRVISDSEGDRQDDIDKSFAQYDQCRIYLNAGGADATIADFLETDSKLEIKTVYEELVSRPQEMRYRDYLSSEIRTMKTDMDAISEYTRRVRDDGIVLNTPPKGILGDNIVDGKGQVVASLDPDQAMVDNIPEDVTLYLKTNYVIPNGIDYNWQDGSIKEGYLKDLTGSKAPIEFLSELTSAVASDDAFNTGGLIWYRKDGSKFEPSDLSTVDKTINTDITNLMSSWSTYWSHKCSYQKGKVIEILGLEAEVLSSDTNFTVNDSEDVLINWQSD